MRGKKRKKDRIDQGNNKIDENKMLPNNPFKSLLKDLRDFDKKGKEIHRFIQKELEISGVKSLKRERRMIRKYMDNWICIEQLVSLFKKRDSPEASRH